MSHIIMGMRYSRYNVNSYADYVPHDIPELEHDSLVELLQQSFKTYRDDPAVHCMGTTLSYAQMDRQSKQFAAWLINNAGLEQGDRVAIMLPNVLQYSVALFGILRAGLVVSSLTQARKCYWSWKILPTLLKNLWTVRK